MFAKSELNFPGRKEYFLCLIALLRMTCLIESNHYNSKTLQAAKMSLEDLEERQLLLDKLDPKELISQLREEIKYYEQTGAKKDMAKVNYWYNVYDRLNLEYEKVILSELRQL